MSVNCKLLVGYTVTLKTNLSDDDYEFYDNAVEKHRIKEQWSSLKPNEVYYIVDGMSGEYARIIYLLTHYDLEEDTNQAYTRIDNVDFSEAYKKLNEVYLKIKKPEDKPLEPSQVELASWLHWS